MKQNKRRVIKWILIAALLIAIVCVVIYGAFVYIIAKGAFMDDGPFTGEIRGNCEFSNPYSEVELPDGSLLESYSSKSESESPTVRHVKTNGEISWCVYANAYDKTHVKSIEFHSAQRYEYDKYLVTGMVHWTFGRENTNWYLSEDGELINYWYSW